MATDLDASENPLDPNFKFAIRNPTDNHEEDFAIGARFINLTFNDEENEWEAIREERGIDICYLYVEANEETGENGMGMVRGICEVDCTPEAFFTYYKHHDLVKQLDPMCLEVEIVKKYDDSHRCVYLAFSAPQPVWERDFIFKEIRLLFDAEGNIVPESDADRWLSLPGRSAAVIITSVPEDHECYLPERDGRVRAIADVGGYLLRDAGDSKSTAYYLGKIDPAGWVPTWVANFVAPNQAKNIGRLRKLVKKLNCEAAGEEFVDSDPEDDSLLTEALTQGEYLLDAGADAVEDVLTAGIDAVADAFSYFWGGDEEADDDDVNEDDEVPRRNNPVSGE